MIPPCSCFIFEDELKKVLTKNGLDEGVTLLLLAKRKKRLLRQRQQEKEIRAVRRMPTTSALKLEKKERAVRNF